MSLRILYVLIHFYLHGNHLVKVRENGGNEVILQLPEMCHHLFLAKMIFLFYLRLTEQSKVTTPLECLRRLPKVE